MATPSKPVKSRQPPVLLKPDQNDPIQVDGGGNVQVVVNDNGNNYTYQAKIFYIGTTTLEGQGPLPQTSGTMYSGPIQAGSPLPPNCQAGNNRTVQVQGSLGGFVQWQDSHDFCAFSGTGSGSGSYALPAGAAPQQQVFRAGQPVPTALLLEPGAAEETPPDPLKQPTVLRHAPDPVQVYWLSGPLDLAPGSTQLGFWQLSKSDSRTWVLVLRRGNLVLVTYRLTTAVEKDGSLPIRLHLEGAGGTEFTNWPRTVTVSPAP